MNARRTRQAAARMVQYAKQLKSSDPEVELAMPSRFAQELTQNGYGQQAYELMLAVIKQRVIQNYEVRLIVR